MSAGATGWYSTVVRSISPAEPRFARSPDGVPERAPLWSRAAPWVAWCTVLFVLYNAGAPHETCQAFDRAVSRGGFHLTSANVFDAIRAYFTNDGDLVRYQAYCHAALGRTYSSYYVRTQEAWQAAFVSGAGDPETAPERTPAVPLRPYRDFLVEYPAGFFLWALPAALVSHTVDTYRVVFASIMAVLLTAALLLTLRVGSWLPYPAPSRHVVGLAVLSVFLVGSVATHRYDAVVALSLAVAVWATFQDRPVWLGLAIGIGTASKIVPVLAVPIVALYLARQRRWTHLAVAAAVAAATGSLGLAPLLWGGSLADTGAYHGLRPLQLESTFAAALGLWHALGGPAVSVVQSYGSSNLTGPVVTQVQRFAMPLTMACLVAVYFWSWIHIRRSGSPSAARVVVLQGLVAALVGFMVLGRVLSPQYLVWIIPLGALLSVRRGGLSPWLLLTVLACTQVIYPATYSALQQLRPWACGLVLLRNLLLVAWLFHLIREPMKSEPVPSDASADSRARDV